MVKEQRKNLNNIDVKEFLQQVYFLDLEIKIKREEIESLESKMTYKSPTISDVNVKGSGFYKESDIKCEIIEYKKVLDIYINNLIRLRQKIVEYIDKVDDCRIRVILQLKYLEYKKYEYIADELNYSTRQISRLHNKGIEMLGIILSEDMDY